MQVWYQRILWNIKRTYHQNYLFHKNMWLVRLGAPMYQLDGLNTWRDLSVFLKSPPRGLQLWYIHLHEPKWMFWNTFWSKFPHPYKSKREFIFHRATWHIYTKRGSSGKVFDLLICFSYISYNGVVWVEC